MLAERLAQVKTVGGTQVCRDARATSRRLAAGAVNCLVELLLLLSKLLDAALERATIVLRHSDRRLGQVGDTVTGLGRWRERDDRVLHALVEVHPGASRRRLKAKPWYTP